MCRTWIVAIAVIVALVVPMSAQGCITTWLFGDDDMVGARVGWQDVPIAP